MENAKEILRLNNQGFSYREIASSVGCGKTVVGQTIKRAGAAGIKDASKYSLSELEKLLFPEKHKDTNNEPDMAYILKELSRKHVTRQLLWEEYKLANPDGLMYTQFCQRIREAKKANEIDYHKIHKGGQECEVDWAGTPISYFDAQMKKLRKAAVFVAVLPASSYPFARAYADQKIPSWIDAHVRAFKFFGGVPKILIPDCLKTAVVSSDLFDPVLSKTYKEMADYYGITVVPARPGKAKDKGAVENAVGNISRRIIAVLRNETFTSIEEINQAIDEKLKAFTNQPFKKIPGCRGSAFKEIDKPMLLPLPSFPYELSHFKEAKIGINYHISYEDFFYSCPFEYRGRIATVRATTTTIEVFVASERICAHKRRYRGSRYVTLPEHLPEAHKVLSEWNDKRFISWAKKYGPNTSKYIQALLGSSEYSVQAYRACMGVLREAKSKDPEIIEAASALALENRVFSSKYFTLAVKQKAKELKEQETLPIIEHPNIRGAAAFKGENYA